MLRPPQLLAAMTALLVITAVAACGAPNAEQPTGPRARKRVIDHAMGRTSVEDVPQRLVVLDTGGRDAGFDRPENQQLDETFAEISREQGAQADGELPFHGSYDPAAKASQDRLVAGQQREGFNAVRGGKAFEVPDDRWFPGWGGTAAGLVLDDLQRHLTQK